jgi:uncharacterized membrane protein
MGRNSITDIFFYAFVVGGIFLVTKPGSTGGAFVKNVGASSVGLVQAATGQTVNSGV